MIADPAEPYRYSCYGLTVASDLALPELLPARAEEAGPADVRVVLGGIPAGGLPGAEQLGPFLWAGEAGLSLEVPGVARYLVRGGDSVLVDPEPGVDEDSVRVFLLGSALGALLFQRGFLVLHGNAVAVGDGCVVFVGPSGAGKSTLAAAFLRRGHRILADDVVPVDAGCRVLPGFPRLKLWEDAAEKLDIETEGLRRIRPHLHKYDYPIHDRYAGDPLPARWVYVLAAHHRDETTFEAVAGFERFRPLRQNTYRVRYMDGMSLRKQHMSLCGALAGRVHLARVTRPEHGFDVDRLVDLILADIDAHP